MNNFRSIIARYIGLFSFIFYPALATSEQLSIQWARIEGITPNPVGGGQTFAANTILPVTFPWSVAGGQVNLNEANDMLTFLVQGLSMGASPTPLALIGTTGAVTKVKGTLLCNLDGSYVDTESVELSRGGDAFFHGQIDGLFCEPEQMIFLLRIAEVIPGAPPIANRWIGYGANRKIR